MAGSWHAAGRRGRAGDGRDGGWWQPVHSLTAAIS